MNPNEVDNIIFQDPKKTFMEILKVHNKEVPFANLLAFFFRPKEIHKLGTLFIDSLLETKRTNISKDKTENIIPTKPIPVYDEKSVEVKVEQKTINDNRIDLLIVTNTFVICIEFKINHDLDNPLDDYKTFIEKHYSERKQFYFILTPFKKDPIGNAEKYFKEHNEFKQIILSHFVKTVKHNLQNTFGNLQKKNEYYHYFNEFIETVDNRKIRSLRRITLNKLSDKLNKSILNKGLESKYHLNNQGGFLEIKKDQKALKIRIKPKGWQIEKWKNNAKYLSDTEIKSTDLIAKIEESISAFFY